MTAVFQRARTAPTDLQKKIVRISTPMSTMKFAKSVKLEGICFVVIRAPWCSTWGAYVRKYQLSLKGNGVVLTVLLM